MKPDQCLCEIEKVVILLIKTCILDFYYRKIVPPIFCENSCNWLKIMEMDSCVCEFFCCSLSHICQVYTQLI